MEVKDKVIAETTLYDFAKKAISAETPMDPIILKREVKKIAADMHDHWHNTLNHKYAMLLCRERYDYTLFRLTNEKTNDEIAEILYDVLTCRNGKVLVMDKLKDGNYEIWIRENETDENFVYYLFASDYVVERL